MVKRFYFPVGKPYNSWCCSSVLELLRLLENVKYGSWFCACCVYLFILFYYCSWFFAVGTGTVCRVMSCHYTTVHCGNMNVVLHPRVASFCPKRMVEMTGNKKWNAADACCWQTLLSSFFCLVSTHSVSLTSGTGWRCCPLRPSTCSSTTRVWAACRWPWLRFTRSSRMKMASFTWPTPPRKCSDTDRTSKHWPAALFMYTATSLSAVNMKKVFIYCTMFV